MLHREFAIDPDQIEDIKDVRLLEGRFGYDKGAVISAFPKRWFGTVAEKLSKSVSDKKVDSISDDLKALKDKAVVSFSRDFTHDVWIDSAKASHQKSPFHRLVESSLNEPPTLVSNIYDLKDPDFHTESQSYRSASGLAEASKLLLMYAEKVTVVDPYICLSKPGYRNTLIELMRRCRKSKVRFNIFCENEGKSDWNSVRKPALQAFVNDIMPENFELHWYSISDGGTGYIHARGLFTAKGGIRYDRGFEVPNDHEQRRTAADVAVMSMSEWEQKVEDYNEVQLPSKFTLEHRWSGSK
ncbi:hypothetical protein [Endozoicomonas arenosclerae]|uniref:hypothetical protein n=1 Tax=Endozoicomonas arenosclerae TaxID=1633495 RepID=UPI000785A1D1|nr:hypothetical protein [Endozoicomonas arenosclerae]